MMSKPELHVALKDPEGWLTLLSQIILFFKDRRLYATLGRMFATDRMISETGYKTGAKLLRGGTWTRELPVVRLYLYRDPGGDVRLAVSKAQEQGLCLGFCSYRQRDDLLRFQGWAFPLMEDELGEMLQQLKQPYRIYGEPDTKQVEASS